MKNTRTVTSFFDKEYLDYARYVVENRAIPSCIDGLKPTQRKVVYIANKIWKTGNEKPMKLFQSFMIVIYLINLKNSKKTETDTFTNG